MSEPDSAFPCPLVVIGASAGGLPAIREIVTRLPSDFRAIVIVATHRDPALMDNLLAKILEHHASLKVRDPVEGENLTCQTLYVGPPSKALVVEDDDARLMRVEEEVRRLERIDALFETAAKFAGERAIGVILSGTLWDGVAGLQAIHEAGGQCLVQDPLDALFPDMPLNALREVEVDYVGSTEEIAVRLTELAGA